MKISELLSEAMIKPRLDIRLEINSAKQMLTEKCSQALKTWGMKPLFRGSRNLGPGVYLIDPSKGERKSENTGNQYTILMDNNPLYSEYPKRSKSLICSTSKDYADGFGEEMFYLYPVDRAKIGITEGIDIWQNELPKNNALDVSTWEEIPITLKYDFGMDHRFDLKQMEAHTKTSVFTSKCDEIGLPSETFFDYMHYIMSPEFSKMRLIDTLTPLPTTEHECWFSSPCIAIHIDFINKFEDVLLT